MLPEPEEIDPTQKTADESTREDIEPADVEQTTDPKELGVRIDESGKIEPDFGEVLDSLQKQVPRDADGKFLPRDAKKDDDKKEADEKEEKAEVVAEPPQESQSLVDAATGKASEKSAAATDRDADLKELEAKLDPHSSPKTKSHFKAQQQATVEARNRADAAEAQAKQYQAELEQAKKTGLPKEVEEELTALRQTVREIDVTRDPQFVAKYDKKITVNNDAIIAVLAKNGFGKDKEGKEIPGVVDALKRAGITRATLDDKIKALEKAGEYESAEEIRDLLRENSRIGRDRETELKDVQGSNQRRAQETQAQQAARIETANKRMTTEFKAHADKFDFLKQPPAVDEKDAPAIRKEKERAISMFNDRVVRLSEAIKKEAGDPENAAITARVGILYRDHIAPYYQEKFAAAQKEIEALTNRLKAMKGAGGLSEKKGTVAPAAAMKEDVDTSASDFGDIVDGIARQVGIKR